MGESRRERREHRRQRRGEQQKQAERGAQIQQAKRLVLLAVPVVAVLALAGYLLTSHGGKEELGTSIPIQGTEHVVRGQPHPAYNSVPPTSGWHYADPAPWGIHSKPIEDEQQIHSLEHGGIMVQHNCDNNEASCKGLVEKLAGVVNRHRSKVILAPYPKMPHRVALTAWGRMLTLDDFDEKKIVAFIQAYKDKGPEKVPD